MTIHYQLALSGSHSNRSTEGYVLEGATLMVMRNDVPVRTLIVSLVVSGGKDGVEVLSVVVADTPITRPRLATLPDDGPRAGLTAETEPAP